MKYFTAFFILLSLSTHSFGQDFFIDSPEKTSAFFDKNKDITLVELQQLLYYEFKNLRDLHDTPLQYDSPYLERLDKDNTNPEHYITYSELPEVYESDYLLELYHEKKEDIGYYTYHNTKSSSASLKSMPRYGKFPYQKNIDLRPLSSYINAKEIRGKFDFKFFTEIDSLKVLYSYKYPKKIDTIRLKVNTPTATNKYGITLKRYEDYGVEAIVPYNPNIKFLDVAGVDKDGKTLLANVLDHYNNYDTENEDLLKSTAFKYKIVQMLHDEIANKEINSINEFLSRLNELKEEFGFKSISDSPIVNQNILFQIFGYADEVVIYIQSEEGFISEKLNVISAKKSHTIFDYYEDETKEWNEPKTYFYNKKKKKKLSKDVYTKIEFLGGNLFRTEQGSRYSDEEYKCERLIVAENGKLKKFDDCVGSIKYLPNDGFMLEYYDDYGIDLDSVKAYNKFGTLKFEGSNGVAMSEIYKDSNFIVISEEEQERFILGNFEITEPFDNYHIYNPHKALIFKGEKCGVIDDFGNELVPTEYENCQLIGHNLLVIKNGEQLIISDSNKIIHKETLHKLEPLEYYERWIGAQSAYLNLATFKENNLLGIKDVNGQIIFPAQAIEIYEVGGPSRIAVRLENNQLGVINEKGETIIPFEYEDINPYYQEYAILISEDGKKITFYNLNGDIKAVHHAKETYEIWSVTGRPTLVIDDKIHIRYNGYIFDRAD